MCGLKKQSEENTVDYNLCFYIHIQESANKIYKQDREHRTRKDTPLHCLKDMLVHARVSPIYWFVQWTVFTWETLHPIRSQFDLDYTGHWGLPYPKLRFMVRDNNKQTKTSFNRNNSNLSLDWKANVIFINLVTKHEIFIGAKWSDCQEFQKDPEVPKQSLWPGRPHPPWLPLALPGSWMLCQPAVSCQQIHLGFQDF